MSPDKSVILKNVGPGPKSLGTIGLNGSTLLSNWFKAGWTTIFSTIKWLHKTLEGGTERHAVGPEIDTAEGVEGVLIKSEITQGCR